MKGSNHEEEITELRRGPWTVEEDTLLIHYISCHGEGLWNLLAKCSGLKRTGKSCRLRWLNYLKPDVKRGNLSPEEQYLILELHSLWGNRWSRIAQQLPGRTDNEIKNYWRTRVLKQARQLSVGTDSAVFRDAVRCRWMPRLLEKIGSSRAVQSIDPTAFANATSLEQVIPGSDNYSSAELGGPSEFPWSPSDELGCINAINPSASTISGNGTSIKAFDWESGIGYDCSLLMENNCIHDMADSLWSMVEARRGVVDGDTSC